MNRGFIAALFVAASASQGIEAAEPAPNIQGETTDQVARRTGYTAEEIRKCFPPIQQWPLEPKPDKMADNFARDRFKAPPKVL